MKQTRKRKISEAKYKKLKEPYLLGISIRKTAEVIQVNKNTIEKYFKKFADAIVECL